MNATRQKVPFRLIQTPCCQTILCYVNPRLPNYCSECGARIYAKLKTGDGILQSTTGWLKLDEEDSPNPYKEHEQRGRERAEAEGRLR